MALQRHVGSSLQGGDGLARLQLHHPDTEAQRAITGGGCLLGQLAVQPLRREFGLGQWGVRQQQAEFAAAQPADEIDLA